MYLMVLLAISSRRLVWLARWFFVGACQKRLETLTTRKPTKDIPVIRLVSLCRLILKSLSKLKLKGLFKKHMIKHTKFLVRRKLNGRDLLKVY